MLLATERNFELCSMLPLCFFAPFSFRHFSICPQSDRLSIYLSMVYGCGHDKFEKETNIGICHAKGGGNVDKHNINYRMQTMTLFPCNMLVYSIINKTCATLCHKAMNISNNNTTNECVCV